ncbi:BCCT family transporter [Gallibacterium anatis]|uniref:BCCT family transporter n=1 Tax=Gallibacterium anatis TaxID=750 RepID=A0A921HCV4_9PAST|nr:BCCT family transporter [Gallibacterium anatis]WKS96187.1 BCCT family transporter [Gallibacterium anatis]HJF74701.1 BCCT family transporter [Gallibacterium anatis]
MRLLHYLKSTSTFKTPIFLPSLLFILLVTGLGIVVPETTQKLLNGIKNNIFDNFSWFYVVAVSMFILFLLLLCASSLGDIKLGTENEEPEYPFMSWMAMLFAAGMGIGLMYFGVAEPISHYVAPLAENASHTEKVENALLLSFFHWGIHAWAIYAVIGLTLAYFSFRYKLPLTIRSGFYPILKHRVSGFWGHLIDIIALCSTVFGVTTTLGYGAMQLDAGLHAVGWMDDRSLTTLSVIIVVVMTLAAISAITGVAKGVRRLSEINLGMAILLMIFVLIAGPTIYLFSNFSENIGNYLSNFIELSFRTFANEPEKKSWFNGWTVLYWAWWVSWAPFVGLFIAKISKGRSIREFILGVLFVPSLFNALWMTIFGDTAIWADQQSQGALSALSDNTEALLFAFFEQLPGSTVASLIAMLIIALFFVTSADSGIYVINNIASQGKDKAPAWQSVFWAVLLASLAIALLRSGGLAALQTMTLIIALPFTLIMLFLCLGLWRGLMVDSQYFSKKFAHGSSVWSGKNWRERLNKIMSQPQRADIKAFFDKIVIPAFTEVESELKNYGLTVKIKTYSQLRIALVIKNDNIHNFLYGVAGEKRSLSNLLIEDDSLPHIEQHNIYEPITFFNDGREGYDVQYMSKDELIVDILKQYERYMNLALDDTHSLLLNDLS